MSHKWDSTTYDEYDLCLKCGVKRRNKAVIKGYYLAAHRYRQYYVAGVWVDKIPDCIPKNTSNESNVNGLPIEPINRGT